MPKLTAGIIARDAATDIRACLESLAWADERLVILDPRTRDDTAAVARELGARVVEHTFEDFGRQREFGLTLLPAGEWLFYVDTDERATAELAEEIRRVIASDQAVGWWVPRRNVIWGCEMRHGGWFPDYQLRLLQVGHAHYDLTREVHEVVNLDGAEGFLRQPLWHHNYRTLGQFIAKQRQYTDYEAAILFKQGVRPKPWTYLLQPLREFRRRYVTLQGYRDGLGGLALCAWVAYYYGFVVTVKNGRLWRTGRGRG
jgi:hypothetical protein